MNENYQGSCTNIWTSELRISLFAAIPLNYRELILGTYTRHICGKYPSYYYEGLLLTINTAVIYFVTYTVLG